MNATAPCWWYINIDLVPHATIHNLSLCWHRSMSPYDVTRPRWVKLLEFVSIEYGYINAQLIIQAFENLPKYRRGCFKSHIHSIVSAKPCSMFHVIYIYGFVLLCFAVVKLFFSWFMRCIYQWSSGLLYHLLYNIFANKTRHTTIAN